MKGHLTAHHHNSTDMAALQPEYFGLIFVATTVCPSSYISMILYLNLKRFGSFILLIYNMTEEIFKKITWNWLKHQDPLIQIWKVAEHGTLDVKRKKCEKKSKRAEDKKFGCIAYKTF